jgi:hypothetical protein
MESAPAEAAVIPLDGACLVPELVAAMPNGLRYA